MPNPEQSVRVSFSDGYHHQWAIPDGETAETTLEQLRQTIQHSMWFNVPGTGKSYSPFAITSVEIITQTEGDEGSTAGRLGQGLRENVIQPYKDHIS
jgi:hypothetical protein